MVAGGMAMRGVHCSTSSSMCEEAVVAGGFEVFGELGGGEVGGRRELRGERPRRRRPRGGWCGCAIRGRDRTIARADGFFDGFAGFEGEEGRVADEDGGVCLLQHGDGVGCGGEEGGVGVEEFAEEDFCVGEGAAGGGVGGDGSYGSERV